MKTLRILLVAALTLAPVAPALALDRLLPAPRIKDNGDVALSDDLMIGRFQSDRYIATPDARQIRGQNLTGDVSGMSIPAPSPSGLPATLNDINSARYSLAQEGGWGKTQADNDRIFQIALDYSANPSATNVTIDVPMGTWRLTVPHTISTTKPFKLRCAGRGQTRIIVDTGSDSLLTITQQTVGAQVSIDGCEFQAASPGVGTPLVIKYAGSAQGPSPYYQYSTVTLHDLSFAGLGNGTDVGMNYFLNGVDIANAWQPVLSSIQFTGAVQNRRGAQNAIILRYSFAAQIRDIFAIYAVRGVYDPGGATNGQNSEGTTIQGGELVDVDYGVEMVGTDTDPGLFIGPLHINAGKSCVKTVFKSQIDISRVLCYKLINDANDFVAIDVVSAAYGYISNIQVGDSRTSNAGGAFTGIKLTGSYGVTISNAQPQGWQNTSGSFVHLAGTTNGTRLFGVDATFVPGLNPVSFDRHAGKDNKFFSLQPALVQGLAVNSATPSVGNDRSGQWTAANSTATSITNFLDGATGQKITIFFQDAVTTLVHGPPLRLRGATNTTVPAGAAITFQSFGTYWVETARSF